MRKYKIYSKGAVNLLLHPFSTKKKYRRNVHLFELENENELSREYENHKEINGCILPLGASQSYGEICIPSQDSTGILVQPKSVDKTIYFEKSSCTVEVAAGVRIVDLVDYLDREGYYLKVVPGADQATVGGCVAADVHGKSSFKDGCFGDYVVEIHIHDFKTCSARILSANDQEFFWTIGGFGATGVIVVAKIKVFKKEGISFLVHQERSTDLTASIDEMLLNSDSYESAVIWFSVQRHRTYCKLMRTSWSSQKALKIRKIPFSSILFWLIGNLIPRRMTFPILSKYIYWKNEKNPACFKAINFPLSQIQGWESLFGKSFQERQFIIDQLQYKQFTAELVDLMRTYGINSPLCAVKYFKRQGVGIMSFARRGISFNILTVGTAKEFHARLSDMINQYNGCEYLAKSTVENSTFPSNYKNYEFWRNLLASNKIHSHYSLFKSREK